MAFPPAKRFWIAVLLLTLGCVFLTARTLRMALKNRASSASESKFEYYEKLLADLRASLSPQTRVQLLLPPPGTRNRQEIFFLVQYTLAPLVVTRKADAPYALSLGRAGEAAPLPADRKLHLVRDYGNGVRLLTRNPAP